MNHSKLTLAMLIIISCLLITPLISYAVNISDVINDLDKTAQNARIIGENPAEAATIYDIIGQILNLVLTSLGVIFLLLMIYGGLTWMTAGGNQEKVKTAGSIINKAVIGLIIILLAWLLTNFVIFRIIDVTTSSTVLSNCNPADCDNECKDAGAPTGCCTRGSEEPSSPYYDDISCECQTDPDISLICQ
ncbi:hypothetical protein KJ840_02015 [Patescibacteria group bacterium]|nr:hypothetical protein [Patescibacteria group bacterium]